MSYRTSAADSFKPDSPLSPIRDRKIPAGVVRFVRTGQLSITDLLLLWIIEDNATGTDGCTLTNAQLAEISGSHAIHVSARISHLRRLKLISYQNVDHWTRSLRLTKKGGVR